MIPNDNLELAVGDTISVLRSLRCSIHAIALDKENTIKNRDLWDFSMILHDVCENLQKAFDDDKVLTGPKS